MSALLFGEMSEWLKEHDWKSCMFRKGHRGFESLSLYHTSPRLRMARHTRLKKYALRSLKSVVGLARPVLRSSKSEVEPFFLKV